MVRTLFVLVWKVIIQTKTLTNFLLYLHLKWKFVIKLLKRGVVEVLTLSRWLQPFTQENDFEIEKSNIVTMSDNNLMSITIIIINLWLTI